MARGDDQHGVAEGADREPAPRQHPPVVAFRHDHDHRRPAASGRRHRIEPGGGQHVAALARFDRHLPGQGVEPGGGRLAAGDRRPEGGHVPPGRAQRLLDAGGFGARLLDPGQEIVEPGEEQGSLPLEDHPVAMGHPDALGDDQPRRRDHSDRHPLPPGGPPANLHLDPVRRPGSGSPDSGRQRRRRDVRRRRRRRCLARGRELEPGTIGAELNHVAGLEGPVPPNPLSVDVGAVGAPQVAQQEAAALLEHGRVADRDAEIGPGIEGHVRAGMPPQGGEVVGGYPDLTRLRPVQIPERREHGSDQPNARSRRKIARSTTRRPTPTTATIAGVPERGAATAGSSGSSWSAGAAGRGTSPELSTSTVG